MGIEAGTRGDMRASTRASIETGIKQGDKRVENSGQGDKGDPTGA